ncbi:MAG: DUF465 domain-containing protein [Acidobacteriota bacterium]
MDDELKAELLETDLDFRNLYEEHRQCEERLEVLQQNASLSLAMETEIKQIKLHKLALKDRMYEILRAHQPATVAATA